MDSGKKRVCCCCIPQDMGVKLWLIWAWLAMILVLISIIYDSRLLIPYLPVLTVCYILVIMMPIVFFKKGLDTYGTRIALFWVWFNSFLGINLYMMFINTNFLGFWNVTHFVCVDETMSMYN